MKKTFLATAGLVVLSLPAPASAADLATRPYTKAPPQMAAAIYDWSGFYLGINGGGGSSHKCWNLVRDFTGALIGLPEGCHDATGGTIGGQIGYRWQTSSWVFGLEAQGNWADFSGNHISVLVPTERLHSRIDAFGLFTGQVGYAWNNVLFYVKGGAAVTGDKYDVSDIPTGLLLASAKETRWGAAAGVGLEFGFAPNWSVGVEYDHLFMDSRDVNFTLAGAFAGTDHIKQDVDIGLVRVNYRFGGPIIAKY